MSLDGRDVGSILAPEEMGLNHRGCQSGTKELKSSSKIKALKFETGHTDPWLSGPGVMSPVQKVVGSNLPRYFCKVETFNCSVLVLSSIPAT